eukprot:m.224805 g.224805  ORF g.224805 m.224805 type:complete len:723 (+) comp33444_c0_seq1:240-2408(+)
MATSLSDEALSRLEDEFLRLAAGEGDQTRLNLQQYLWCIESVRQLLPMTLCVPHIEVETAFLSYPQRTQQGVDFHQFLEIVNNFQTAHSTNVVPPVEESVNKTRISHSEPPQKQKKPSIVDSGASIKLPKDKPHKKPQRQQSVSTDIATKLGRWFGVRGPNLDGGIVIRSPLQDRDRGFGVDKAQNRFVLRNMFDTPGNVPTKFDGRIQRGDGPTMITDYRAGISAYRKYVAKEKVYRRKNFTKMLTDDGTMSRSSSFRTNTSKGPTRRDGDEEDVKQQLMSLPTFEPRFIPLITFVQLAVMCAMLFDSFSKQQFAKIGLASNDISCTTEIGKEPQCPIDFGGFINTTVKRVEPVNVWIGPDPDYLIKFGARYTPCMRIDRTITTYLDRQRVEQCGTISNKCDNPMISGGEGYSCCTKAYRDYGMLSKEECAHFEPATYWLDDLDKHRKCDEGSEMMVLHPCCVGSEGQCHMYTESQCSFFGGKFHQDKQLCSETACLQDTCTTIFGTKPKVNQNELNKIEAPNQWYRFVWPLFMHAGVIHYILCMLVQWVVGTQIERTAGWLRVALIYFVSGIGGYLISGLFDPYVVAVGSDPAIFGLLAVLVVELFQSWKIVPNPWWECFKLITVTIVAFVVGTFPFIDNFGHLGGFFFGLLSAIVFIPYITFGKWDYARKRILLYICIPMLLIIAVSCLVSFYVVQNTDFCPWCKNINCIEYSKDIKCT